MKRWFSSLLIVGLVGALLIGCSNTSTTESEKAPENTRTIKHAMGETKVPQDPKRVVVLTNEGLEAVLALGIKPVGTVESFTGDPWYPHLAKQLESVTPVGDELQPNLEKILSLKPDLIIGNKMRQEKIYDQLSKIAPTVFAEDLRGDWKVNFTFYSQALNKEETGKAKLAEYDAKVAKVRENAGDMLQQKISMIRFMPGKTRIYQQQTFSGVILKEVGFARPELQNQDSFTLEVGRERIPDMDGDILFYFTYNDKKTPTQGTDREQEFLKDPLWQNLNAVKNNHAFKVDDIIWNTAGGYQAAMIMLDQLNDFVTQLKAK
ncbi:ABC transporter substrate-binding protein [Risungbinella massiliensis]|uniref:ABC transporter substrate-binding protein n=1 Tax=Risungbinella massiliensis TaxID=1329796 RepID=UPI0005CBE48A|nr:iron-siderophore ABC transporter substrate-binding protein [Risungbinella massiliensis]